jgi:hypothetical protein
MLGRDIANRAQEDPPSTVNQTKVHIQEPGDPTATMEESSESDFYIPVINS